MVVASELPLEAVERSHGEATSTPLPPLRGSTLPSEEDLDGVDERYTHLAGKVWITNCVNPEGFHNDHLTLVCSLEYVRETASVEWLLLNSLQFFGKGKRLRKDSRGTAQLLQALEVFPSVLTDPDTVKSLVSRISVLVVLDTRMPAHLVKIIRDLLCLLVLHIHHFLDSGFAREQECSGVRRPVFYYIF